MGPVLGVEAGGSHCHAVLADTSGRVIGIGANQDPANWDDVGIEAAAGAIRSSVFALAGVDFPMDEQLLAGIPSAIGITGPCRIANDAFASLRAGTERSEAPQRSDAASAWRAPNSLPSSAWSACIRSVS